MKYRAGLILLSLLGGFSVTAQAETLSDALQTCSKTDNSLQRLVCYDRVVKDMQQYSGLDEAIKRGYPVVPNPTANNRPTPAPVQPTAPRAEQKEAGHEFGLEHTKELETDMNELVATVTDVSQTPLDKYVLTLSDGTIWVQTDSSRLKVKVNDSIQIERGMLGAFYLTKPGMNRQMKVRRLQ